MTSGASIAAAARGWLGTRFHHQGRLKKTTTHAGGVDCLGLLIEVARELNLSAQDGRPFVELDETNYSHYPDTVRMRTQLAKALRPIPVNEYKTGDVVLIRIDSNPQHLAIISDLDGVPGLIHAYAPARAVVEHALDNWWSQRIVAAYRSY
jgi:hypothetical protein